MSEILRRPVTSVILTGTKGRQLNFEKAFRRDGRGRTYLERMLTLASAHSSRTLVVAPAGTKYSDLPIWENVEVYGEDDATRGILGGILTAMRRTTSRYLLCLTCDMPYVSENFLQELGLPEEEEHARFTRRTFFPFILKNDVLVAKTLSRAVASGLLSVESFLYSIRARMVGPVSSFSDVLEEESESRSLDHWGA